MQVAVTLVLVCGAGLLVATLRNLRAIDPGFVPTHLVAIEVETRGTAFESRRHRAASTARSSSAPARSRECSMPRWRRASPRSAVAMRSFPYVVVGQPRREGTEVSVTVVTPGYLATTRTPILAGRDFVEADTPAGERVAIANEAFVRRHFPVGSPLGARVRIDGLNGGELVTIVGVARDVRLGDRRSPPEPMLHIPAAQAGKWPFLLLLMRTRPRAGAGRARRDAVRSSRMLHRLRLSGCTNDGRCLRRGAAPRAARRGARLRRAPCSRSSSRWSASAASSDSPWRDARERSACEWPSARNERPSSGSFSAARSRWRRGASSSAARWR